jgi:hypothetical protein
VSATNLRGVLAATVVLVAGYCAPDWRFDEYPLHQWRRGLVDPGTRGSAHAPRNRRGKR